ncbi:MAG: alpha/beta hydrolase [Actinobacteria bacterium]|nr:alpha/beta hydrolase [Actinomycetota bacterium]
MHFTSEKRIDDVLVEREFTIGDFSGILWTPVSASTSTPAPLILLGQPGGLSIEKMLPRLRARARSAAQHGLAAVAIEQPGAEDRPALPGAAQAREDLRRALSAGKKPDEDVIDRLILPLVENAVPEWQLTLDEVLTLPEIGDRAAISGGVIAIATRLAATDPRIAAAGLFAGSYVPSATMDDARRVSVPLHVLLQWDDEGNDRQMALELFDAFGSSEKTLYANMGGHTGVPEFAGEDAARFFARHLRTPQEGAA